jgi:hypothetical protein
MRLPVFDTHTSSAAFAASQAAALVDVYRARADVASIARDARLTLRFKGGAPARSVVVVFDVDDTLVYANGEPLHEIVALARALYEGGARIHIITARLDSTEAVKWTARQLRNLGVRYHTLALAPEAARVDLVAVGRWKQARRRVVAETEGAPVLLTIGDMSTDGVLIDTEDDLDTLEKARRASAGSSRMGYTFLRPNDGASLFMLKLPYIDR